MTSDLLFSVLPREGKVPIKHDTQKVEKIDKQNKLKPLSDEEQELHVEEREARQQQQDQHHPASSKKAPSKQEGQSPDSDNQAMDDSATKKPKGPKHLDIYV
jgi:hypothetical protein